VKLDATLFLHGRQCLAVYADYHDTWKSAILHNVKKGKKI
jgi:hypothetical protein